MLAAAAWVLRRSVGGALAGGLGWTVAMGASRVLADLQVETGPELEMAFSGGVAGLFLGSVAGLLERRAVKALAGAAAGLAGGAAGGWLAAGVLDLQFAYTYVLALALMWSVGGAVLGLVLGGVERSWPQAGAGGVAGLLGGLLGAAVGAQLYLAINFETRHVTWTVSRLSEMLEGGALGAGLWCSLSLARRVVLEWRRA